VANWTAKVAAAFHAIAAGLGRHKKVKSTPFDETNGKAPFNASGVAKVGPGRFVFIDNNDPSALFELALSADGKEVGSQSDGRKGSGRGRRDSTAARAEHPDYRGERSIAM